VAGAGIPAGAQEGVVERIVDGDTLWVRVDRPGGPLVAHATHKIRLLEIDTPETVAPGQQVQCGGPEASAYAAGLLPVGSTVYLLADREDTDQYGRFLRYLWTSDGTFFNLEAVRTGHARAVLFEPNDAYIDVLRDAEAQARQAGRGVWGQFCPAGN
jgi:micrococcal nuclease